MPVFQPSPLSYGSADSDRALEVIEQVAPVVLAATEQVTDAARQVETLKAQIQNTKRAIRLTPIGGELLRMRLRKLRARLKAAERRLVKQQESESSTRTYRALGQVGSVVGIGLLVALTVRVLR